MIITRDKLLQVRTWVNENLLKQSVQKLIRIPIRKKLCKCLDEQLG